MSVIHYHTPGILNTKPDLISSTDCKWSSDVIFTETISCAIEFHCNSRQNGFLGSIKKHKNR